MKTKKINQELAAIFNIDSSELEVNVTKSYFTLNVKGRELSKNLLRIEEDKGVFTVSINQSSHVSISNMNFDKIETFKKQAKIAKLEVQIIEGMLDEKIYTSVLELTKDAINN